MEEIAPKYDVIVLGTGMLQPPHPFPDSNIQRRGARPSNRLGLHRILMFLRRLDRVYSFWVGPAIGHCQSVVPRLCRRLT